MQKSANYMKIKLRLAPWKILKAFIFWKKIHTTNSDISEQTTETDISPHKEVSKMQYAMSEFCGNIIDTSLKRETLELYNLLVLFFSISIIPDSYVFYGVWIDGIQILKLIVKHMDPCILLWKKVYSESKPIKRKWKKENVTFYFSMHPNGMRESIGSSKTLKLFLYSKNTSPTV